MNTNCFTCNFPTEPEKRIIVTAPDGSKEYFCNGGCADARKDALTPEKQFCSFESDKKTKYLNSK